MKKIFIMIMAVLMLLSVNCLAANFIHPLDFKGSKAEKEQVVKYIEENVKETYSKIGMDNPSVLRMMEKANLDAFKKLMKATNRELLDKVIDTYCGIGMCNYKTINMMYEKEFKESQKKLDW